MASLASLPESNERRSRKIPALAPQHKRRKISENSCPEPGKGIDLRRVMLPLVLPAMSSTERSPGLGLASMLVEYKGSEGLHTVLVSDGTQANTTPVEELSLS